MEKEKTPQSEKKRQAERQTTSDDPPVKKRCADGALAGDGGRFETNKAVVHIGHEKRVVAKETHEGETNSEEKEGKTKEEQQQPTNKEETQNPFANVYFASASTPTILPFGTSVNSTSTASGNGGVTFGSAAGFGATFGTNSTTGRLFGSSNGTTHDSLAFNTASTTAFGSSAATDDTKISFFGGGTSAPSSKTSFSFGTSSAFSTTEGEVDQIANDDDRDAVLAASASVSNGEEEEECIFQTRAKLFKFVPVVECKEEEEEKKENSGAGIASVPPANTIGTASHNISCPSVFDKKTSTEARDAKSKGGETENKVLETESNDEKTENNDGEAENADGGSENKEGDADKERKKDPKLQEKAKDLKSVTENKMYYKEIGIGPVRLLRKKSDQAVMRIVQRRESTPGGPGTKVILNIPLRLECKVLRQADKFVKLGTPEVVDAAQPANITAAKYLFKVKTVADANALEMALKDGIADLSNIA